jgi:hypothetical protein
MLRNDPNADVVVRLLDGQSDKREIVLNGGRSAEPFAVGSRSAWRVSAAHVSGAHVMLAFNGSRLFVCAFPGQMALLDGVPLDARWTEAATPSELRFGGARLSIGRRAGHDDPTQVPYDEATRLADARQIAPQRTPRMLGEDAVTSFDDDKLRAALALCTREDEVTRIAEVDVPPAAKGPSNEDTTASPSPPPPAPRPVNHTMRIVRKPVEPPRPSAQMRAEPEPPAPLTPSGAMTAALLAGLASVPVVPAADIELLPDSVSAGPSSEGARAPFSCGPSSMPPTIPSDGLMAAAMPSYLAPFPVAAARPSSPTMAIPLPVERPITYGDSYTPPPHYLEPLHAASLAVSGEGPRVATPRAHAPATSTASVAEQKLAELGMAWRRASLPKRAAALLMVPALLGALLTMRPAAAPEANARAGAAEAEAASAATGATPQAVSAVQLPTSPSARVATGTAASAATSVLAGSASAEAKAAEQPKAAAAGLRDTRSAERRALDTVASGLDGAAADQYAALAASQPDNLAFGEAARILRARAANRHD